MISHHVDTKFKIVLIDYDLWYAEQFLKLGIRGMSWKVDLGSEAMAIVQSAVRTLGHLQDKGCDMTVQYQKPQLVMSRIVDLAAEFHLQSGKDMVFPNFADGPPE
jgi:hypothetical protein